MLILQCQRAYYEFRMTPAKQREIALDKKYAVLLKRHYTLCAQSKDPDVVKTYNKYRQTCFEARELARQARVAYEKAQDEYNSATESQILLPAGKTVNRRSGGAGSVR